MVVCARQTIMVRPRRDPQRVHQVIRLIILAGRLVAMPTFLQQVEVVPVVVFNGVMVRLRIQLVVVLIAIHAHRMATLLLVHRARVVNQTMVLD